MPIERSKDNDYKPLHNSKPARGRLADDIATLSPPASDDRADSPSLISLGLLDGANESVNRRPERTSTQEIIEPEPEVLKREPPSPGTKEAKRKKKVEKDRLLLSEDHLITRNGHTLTYVGLYLFSIMVLFRPYELVPGLGFLSATAFYFAIATLAIYIPSQLAAEGTLTIFPTEVKAILAMTVISLATMPIVAAPGNYGLRMLSIFLPGLDVVGSHDQRWELLMRSLHVTARNPWGVGIGNSTIFGVRPDLWRNRDMLNPFKGGFFAVEMILHKLLRYAVPIILFTLFVANLVLAGSSAFFAILLSFQAAFYVLALAGWLLERAGQSQSVLAMPLYFMLANLASVVAFYKFLRGETVASWNPIRQIR